MKNLLKLVSVACPLFAISPINSTVFAAPVVEDQIIRSEVAPIAERIKQLTSPELNWETRFEAEEQLKNFDSQTVLLELIPHANKSASGILFGSVDSAQSAKNLPPQWQIYYAVQRVWRYHERELHDASAQQLAPLNQKLLAEFKDNPASKGWIATKFEYGPPALWTNETEIAFAELMRDSQNNNYLRSLAIEGLLHKTGAKYYPEAKAIIVAFPENSSDEIFAKAQSLEHLLWDVSLQKNEKTGQLETDKELLKTAFELLPKMEQLRVGGGYFLALRLGNYVGQKFVADQKNLKYQKAGNLSEDFFGDTTNNALAWWNKNKQ